MEKSNKSILIGTGVIVLSVAAIFLIDYFQTQSLLKNGIRTNGMITGRFYEVSSGKDTSGYSIRLQTLSDTNVSQGSFAKRSLLNAYVKKETFYKHEEGSIVKVVYYPEDADHARLLEEIE